MSIYLCTLFTGEEANSCNNNMHGQMLHDYSTILGLSMSSRAVILTNFTVVDLLSCCYAKQLQCTHQEILTGLNFTIMVAWIIQCHINTENILTLQPVMITQTYSSV